MAEKFYFTKEGMAKFRAKLDADEKRLKDMYNRLAYLAEVGGDQYHDNFSYEQQMRDINLLDGHLSAAKKVLSNCVIVEPTKNPNNVCLGAKVVIERGNTEERWEIVGYGESDVDHGKISYNTPLVQAMMGKKAGDIFEFRGASIAVKSVS